jgi:uncharacterized membrane protein YphA (DoxX/SURF4 family)
MKQYSDWRKRIGGIFLWVATIAAALGIGLVGMTKFLQVGHWQSLFAGWGFPSWFVIVIGTVEVLGAIGLLIPRFALFAASMLAIVMLGALGTLLTHPGGPMGWGATPIIYLCLLAGVGAARWKRGKRAHPEIAPV